MKIIILQSQLSCQHELELEGQFRLLKAQSENQLCKNETTETLLLGTLKYGMFRMGCSNTQGSSVSLMLQ